MYSIYGFMMARIGCSGLGRLGLAQGKRYRPIWEGASFLIGVHSSALHLRLQI